jgi:hypothetical protein
MSEPVLKAEDVALLLAGPGDGDKARVDADRGVEPLSLYVPLDQLLDVPGGEQLPQQTLIRVCPQILKIAIDRLAI